KYQLVILPDTVTLTGEFLEKVEKYLENGGKLLLSSASGLNPAKTEFALNLGLELVGKSEFVSDYLVPTVAAPTSPVRSPFVVHGGACNILAADDFEVLATRREPYFNRAWDHFCSHQHTPDVTDSPFVGAVSNGNVAYFAHAIFTCYRQMGQPLYRDMVADALRSLLPSPRVETNLPTAGRCSLMSQAEENRWILHLLFAVPQKRGADQSSRAKHEESVEVIEDLYPLRDVACVVRTSQPVKNVRLVPSLVALDFEVSDGEVHFVLPELLCHAMVEIQH
ncbi:alpha-amylase, partial [bacterium]